MAKNVQAGEVHSGESRNAWLLVASSWLLGFVASGPIRAVGPLFVALMDQEQLTRREASWPFSLVGLVNIVAAPLTGISSRRYSATRLTLVGSALLFIGHVPCFFTTDVVVLSVFYGVVRGCGITLLVTLIPAEINSAFTHHRSTAMGIYTSSMPLGGLALPPLFQLCINQYGLRGTFLILAGISLNTFAGSLAYKFWQVGENSDSRKSSRVNSASKCCDETSPLLGPANFSGDAALVEERPSAMSRDYSSSSCSVVVVPDYHSKSQDTTACTELAPCTLKETELPCTPSQPELPRNEKDGLGTCSQKSKGKRKIRVILKEMFTSRGFYLILGTQTLCVCGNLFFLQVIIDYMTDKDIPSTASVYMITIASVGEVFGKLFLCRITDKKLLSFAVHDVLFLSLGALALLVLPFTDNYLLLMLANCVYGASYGTVISNTYAQLSDYFRTEDQNLNMAVQRGITGVFFLTIPAVIGYVRDSLGSYDYFFYSLSGAIMLLALCWTVERVYNPSTRQPVPAVADLNGNALH